MKREDIYQKFFELIGSQFDELSLKDRIDHYMTCGAIDHDDFGNDYYLPKILLVVILQDIINGYVPFGKEGRDIIKNLSHF